MSNWLTILIALLIVIVIADGIRRTWKARRSRLYESPSLKKSLKNSTTKAEDDIEEKPSYLSELPNGGARVVGYRDPKDIPLPKSPSIGSRDLKTSRVVDEPIRRTPEQTRLNLSETVPILMQPVESNSASDSPDKKYQRIEPTISANEFVDTEYDSAHPTFTQPQTQAVESENDLLEIESTKVHPSFTRAELTNSHAIPNEATNEYAVDEVIDDYQEEENLDDDDQYQDEYDEIIDEDDDFEDDYEDTDDEDDDYESDDEELIENDWDEPEDDLLNESQGETRNFVNEKESVVAKQPQVIEPEEVIVINVMAQRAQVFEGNELLDIVLKCGLRFGSMNIFHRYSGNKGDGTLLFSMANIVKPGTFDLDTMDEFTTLGVSLFLTLPLDADSLQSFELMLETAQAIAQTLDGELKDEYRSVMTKQTIEHYRQRIRDFERKKLFRRPQ